MSRHALQRCAAGLRVRNGAPLWLLAAALFALAWSASSLTPAQAARGPELTTALGTAAHEHALAQVQLARVQLAHDQPARLETDLPQYLDNTSHPDFDDNAALQRQDVVSAFRASPPRSIVQRDAAPLQRARAFNPRAPPLH